MPRRPHPNLDLDATLERIARWVEVEREVHALRHNVFRQATRHLVEAEAWLRRAASDAEQQPDDCERSSYAAGKSNEAAPGSGPR